MWESRPEKLTGKSKSGKITFQRGKCVITNGKRYLSLTKAYRYIVDKRSGWPKLADKKIAMRELGLNEAEYQEFGAFVCEKLAIPDDICKNFEGE